MYGFNGYRPGSRPGMYSFSRPNGSQLQLGAGTLADKIRGAIDARNRAVTPAQGQAAGMAANNAAMNVGPTAQGQAAGAAAAQAATNASAGAQPLAQWARGQAIASRPMMPDGAPDYALGTPAPRPTAHYRGNDPAYAPIQSPLDRIGGHGGIQPPAAQPPPRAPGQAPMVSPDAMVATLGTPEITPKTHMAHEIDGRTVVLRNGADPRNPGAGDLMVYEGGQWISADPSLGSKLYEQLHITP